MGKKNGGELFERAAAALGLPRDIVAGVSRVEIIGGNEVLVTNHQGIIEYGDTEMVVNGGRAVLRIKGADLRIASMNADEMRISGTVFSIDYAY